MKPGSIAADVIFVGDPVYGTTKAAVTRLTRNLRAPLGPRGVRVRTVNPAFAVTELGADMVHEATRAGLVAVAGPGGWRSRCARLHAAAAAAGGGRTPAVRGPASDRPVRPRGRTGHAATAFALPLVPGMGRREGPGTCRS